MSVKGLIKNELNEMEASTRARQRMLRGFSAPPGSIVLFGGDPLDVNQPRYIADVVHKAILDGYTHYALGGDPEFKEAIADYYQKFGAEISDPRRQVIINSGGSTGIFQSLAAILNQGDEVLIFDPTYSAYPQVIQFLGGKIVRSPMYENDEGYFRPDLEALKEHITEKTKSLIICNPDNPTGCVFRKRELKAVADLAVDHDFVVLSDEIYQEFIWCGREHVPIISFPGMEDRTIIVMSFSKTFVWTGCRVGCVISGPKLAPYISKVPLSLGLVPGAFQRAGIVVLQKGWDFVESLRQRYDDAVEYCSKRLNNMTNISCVKPEATFYIWPDISATGLSSTEFCNKLMKEEKVRIRPGDEYGSNGKGRARLALVTPKDGLIEAMDKIERFVEQSLGDANG